MRAHALCMKSVHRDAHPAPLPRRFAAKVKRTSKDGACHEKSILDHQSARCPLHATISDHRVPKSARRHKESAVEESASRNMSKCTSKISR